MTVLLRLQIFERYGRRVQYYIETKQPEAAPGMEDSLVALLERFDLMPASPDDRRVLVQSFSPASLERLSELAPTLPLIQRMLPSSAING